MMELKDRVLKALTFRMVADTSCYTPGGNYPAITVSCATPEEMQELIKDQQARIEELEGVKNNAYWERNQLVAALSKLFPASLERHPDSDTAWENDWRWIVMINLPTGQASWHIYDSELPNFNHLHREAENYHSWDGHTTEEKYKRLYAISIKSIEVK